MSTVQCVTCGQAESPIEGRISLREPLKSQVQASVGAACWGLWRDQQLRVINEYRLNLAEPKSRDVIELAARQFLKLGDAPGGEMLVTGPDKAKELGNL